MRGMIAVRAKGRDRRGDEKVVGSTATGACTAARMNGGDGDVGRRMRMRCRVLVSLLIEVIASDVRDQVEGGEVRAAAILI